MTVRETVNASKERFGADSLPQVFEGATEVVVAKGKKVLSFDLKQAPPDPVDFAKAVLGPSGNLRAPAIRTGKKWLVGFHEEAYTARFG